MHRWHPPYSRVTRSRLPVGMHRVGFYTRSRSRKNDSFPSRMPVRFSFLKKLANTTEMPRHCSQRAHHGSKMATQPSQSFVAIYRSTLRLFLSTNVSVERRSLPQWRSLRRVSQRTGSHDHSAILTSARHKLAQNVLPDYNETPDASVSRESFGTSRRLARSSAHHPSSGPYASPYFLPSHVSRSARPRN